MKNIPLPSKETYIHRLIDKTEKLIKRMRWKAFFFNKDDEEDDVENNKPIYKTRNCPPQIPELKDFETDLITLIENVEFRTTSNEFLKTLKLDTQKIKQSKKKSIRTSR